MPSDFDDEKFFRLRVEGKLYVSKAFTYSPSSTEKMRNITMVMAGSDQFVMGEIQGSLCLRSSGEKRKTQVVATVHQDSKNVRRLTLQSFKTVSNGSITTTSKDSFTFRGDEFERLNKFLSTIEFINLSNQNTFQVEDISETDGPKTIVDAPDRHILDVFKNLSATQRALILDDWAPQLTKDEVNIILGRKRAYAEMSEHISNLDWKEPDWQKFFEREDWIFGYGLDYKIMKIFDREMTVGGARTDDRERAIVDFLMTFTDYTVIVEIKRPDTPLFQENRAGRAGTWRFSNEFMEAISQILEQKAQWLASSQQGAHYDRSGRNILEARTRNSKAILVIGNRAEFAKCQNPRDRAIMMDTFELFRRETPSIEILCFDELQERARFILSD